MQQPKPVVQAHNFACRADEAAAKHQWESASQLYESAAELFDQAGKGTGDANSTQALKILADSHRSRSSRAAREVLRKSSLENSMLLASRGPGSPLPASKRPIPKNIGLSYSTMHGLGVEDSMLQDIGVPHWLRFLQTVNRLVKALVVKEDDDMVLQPEGGGLLGSVYLVDHKPTTGSASPLVAADTPQPAPPSSLFQVTPASPRIAAAGGARPSMASPTPATVSPETSRQNMDSEVARLLSVVERLSSELNDLSPLRDHASRVADENRRLGKKLSETLARQAEFKQAWDLESRAFAERMQQMQDPESLFGAYLAGAEDPAMSTVSVQRGDSSDSEGSGSGSVYLPGAGAAGGGGGGARAVAGGAAAGEAKALAAKVAELESKVVSLQGQLQESSLQNAKQAILIKRWDKKWQELRASARKRRAGGARGEGSGTSVPEEDEA